MKERDDSNFKMENENIVSKVFKQETTPMVNSKRRSSIETPPIHPTATISGLEDHTPPIHANQIRKYFPKLKQRSSETVNIRVTLIFDDIMKNRKRHQCITHANQITKYQCILVQIRKLQPLSEANKI